MNIFKRIWNKPLPRSVVEEKYITACLLYGQKKRDKQEHLKREIRKRLAQQHGITKTRHRRKMGMRIVYSKLPWKNPMRKGAF